MFKKYFKSRLDYLRAIILLIALLLIFRLADLQIVQGDYYKNRAENIRTRTIRIDAPRGPIVDRYGRTLAGNKMSYSANIMKADLPKTDINEIALTVINIIEKNGDTYKDEIPILINPIRFTFYEDELNWKRKYNISDNATVQEAFAKIRQDNEIPEEMVDIEAYEMLTQQFGIELPFSLENYQFTFKKDELRWKKSKNFDENATAEEIFNKLVKNYSIARLQNGDANGYSDEEVKKILSIRYLLSQNVYKAYEPVEIASNISEQTRSQLEESRIFLPGVEIIQKPIREYPNADFASHILGYMSKIGAELEALAEKGYTGQHMIGKSGIESTMEQYLKGQDGTRQIEIDVDGVMIDTVSEVEPTPGDTIFLTIDYKLQKVAEDALKQTMETIQKGDKAKGVDPYPNATSGAVVALDINSGRVLALASNPTYDPNLFASGISSKNWKALQPSTNEQYAPKPLINNAVTTALPPGSVMKMLAGLAGLENNNITINEIIIDKGPFEIGGGYAPSCAIWKSNRTTHGAVDINKAIQKSCNYYFFEVGRRMGGDVFEKYAKLFGLGARTGIELTGEAYGTVSGPSYKRQLYKGRLNYYLNYKLNIKDEALREKICAYIDKDMEYSQIKAELQQLGLDKNVVQNIVNVYIAESKWKLYDSIQSTIGQNFNTTTPIQIASYIASLVNGGTRYKPYLVEKVVSYDGTVKVDKTPEIVQKIEMELSNIEAIKKGMLAVTTPGGTGYREFMTSSIPTGGKTGTAQANKADNHAWFVAFAPYDKPEIAVAAVVVQGGHGNYAAPIARAIIEQYLTAEEVRDNITPTNDMIQ
ncbi:MAG: mrdA [Clostridia bacterium]|nr:mrdA [Clostridia bacterium]